MQARSYYLLNWVICINKHAIWCSGMPDVCFVVYVHIWTIVPHARRIKVIKQSPHVAHSETKNAFERYDICV